MVLDAPPLEDPADPRRHPPTACGGWVAGIARFAPVAGIARGASIARRGPDETVGGVDMTARRPALFLDRDGTVCAERGYLADPDGLELIPGAAAAVAAARTAGYAVVLATNQSGVARGYFDLEAVDAFHRSLQERLAAAAPGARFDAVYVCPHHPEGAVSAFQATCPCRKPAPGLLLQAAAEHRLDLQRSWMIGDRLRDLEAGWAAGCRAALVRSAPPPCRAVRAGGVRGPPLARPCPHRCPRGRSAGVGCGRRRRGCAVWSGSRGRRRG